jgi:transcriptional antiterminator RfaH
LRAWNIETCYPRLKDKRYSSFTQLPVLAIKPLFPGYIFARFDARTMLSKVWFTRGVRSVVSSGGRPLTVTEDIILLIRSQIGPEGFVNTGQQLAIGDKVRITGGLLQDFVGIFEANANAARRVRLLLSAVNYQCRIDIDRELIERVAAASGS